MTVSDLPPRTTRASGRPGPGAAPAPPPAGRGWSADVSAAFPRLTGLAGPAGGMIAGGILGPCVGAVLVVVPAVRATRDPWPRGGPRLDRTAGVR
jgi:hypothetical protein